MALLAAGTLALAVAALAPAGAEAQNRRAIILQNQAATQSQLERVQQFPPPPTATVMPESATGQSALQRPLDPLTSDLSEEIQIAPFGANLFSGAGGIESGNAPNPDYLVTRGDQVEVRIWGAFEFNGVLTVDTQGNIFLNTIGPVAVEGVASRDLTAAVAQAVANVYPSSVNVYTNLPKTQPIAVYVTGFVTAPGRYAGTASDSVLYYLNRARGVDLRRGSFRTIDIIRDDKRILTVDLYEFLLQGKLAKHQLADNDMIVVHPRGATIKVLGLALNLAEFEFSEQRVTGQRVIELANPTSHVTHVSLRGSVAGREYHKYIPRKDFPAQVLNDGDEITFVKDQAHETFFVNVDGEFSGQSSFPVRRGMRLSQLLHYIDVDPQAANLEAIYLRRQSVAEVQQKLLEESLHRLREALFKDEAISRGEADIRAREAQVIEQFIRSAGLTKASGRLVIAHSERFRDVTLEADDVVVIPRRQDVIHVAGEILVPQSVLFDNRFKIVDYARLSGGLSERGAVERFLIYHQNGEVSVNDESKLAPGDRILFMPHFDRRYFQLALDVTELIYRVALTALVFQRD